MWDNVDNIIRRIESKIDSISHTTDLYDPQFCLKEHEDSSLQFSKFIRKFVHTKITLGVICVFNNTVFPFIDVSLSFKFVVSLEDQNIYWYFAHLAMIF